MLDYATTWGDPDAPTALLLHPAGETRHAWTPHAEALDDVHAVAIDLPAHGSHPDPDFTFDRAVADVGAVLDAVGPAALVGHSQGGYVALRAATAHERRVRGLLLAGAAYNWRQPKMLAMTAVSYPLAQLLAVAARSDRLRAWLSGRLAGDDPRQDPPASADTRSPLHGHVASLRAAALQRTWHHVEAYGGPVLVAHGASEPLRDHARTLAERADARLEWYEGGHQAPMTDPETFAALVADFLEEVSFDRPTDGA